MKRLSGVSDRYIEKSFLYLLGVSLLLHAGLFALLLILVAMGMFFAAEWAEKRFPREEY